MCIYVCVWGCLDKYISVATWPPKQKFLAPPLNLPKKIGVGGNVVSIIIERHIPQPQPQPQHLHIS